jgi:hypothetical protein
MIFPWLPKMCKLKMGEIIEDVEVLFKRNVNDFCLSEH